MAHKQRGNWLMRLGAVLGSAGAFVGFWQLAAHHPHPATDLTTLPTVAPTPTDSYAVPTGTQSNPLPLPAPPHGTTGVSH